MFHSRRTRFEGIGVKTMNCISCGKTAQRIYEMRPAKYRDDTVVVLDDFFRCESCGEEFVVPEQIREHAYEVKNAIRKKYALLSPEKIVEIRQKARLTQAELEELLGTGKKVVVRWEKGKVVQSAAHDLVLRLLDKDPQVVKRLKEFSRLRARQREEYSKAHSHAAAHAT